MWVLTHRSLLLENINGFRIKNKKTKAHHLFSSSQRYVNTAYLSTTKTDRLPHAYITITGKLQRLQVGYKTKKQITKAHHLFSSQRFGLLVTTYCCGSITTCLSFRCTQPAGERQRVSPARPPYRPRHQL